MTVFTTADAEEVRMAAQMAPQGWESHGMSPDDTEARLLDLADRLEREAVDPARPYFDRLGILHTPETP